MNIPRVAAASAVVLTLARKVGSFALRFLRDQPRTAAEARVFVHLNGLVETVVSQLLNRTFTPTPLRAVQ